MDPRQYRNHKKGPGNVHPQPLYQQAPARSLCNSQVYRVNRVAEVKGAKEAFRIIQKQQDFTKQMLEEQQKVDDGRVVVNTPCSTSSTTIVTPRYNVPSTPYYSLSPPLTHTPLSHTHTLPKIL